ncbi:MAG TPA: universal stress protein [Vicinamibacteria bacterium]|nr:universal stress protein [Vicinamibacteria bacterium]
MKRILCPVDFSEHSFRALDRAASLADWFDANVTALHVVSPLPGPGLGLPYFPAPLETTHEQGEQAERKLRDLAIAFLADRVTLETRVRGGDPWREITAEAEELPADLVVMGTHGRSGFEHFLLGSVTENVLRRVSCPVLTVGNLQAPPHLGPPFRRILCATDLTKGSERTVDFALSLAEDNQADLTLLHVIEGLPDQSSGAKLYLAVPEIGPLRRDLTEQAREALRRAVPDEAREWCEVRERVDVGIAWRAILQAAEETNPDLVVVGAQGRAPVGERLFASTAGHVVRGAACPVLVVRGAKPRRRACFSRAAAPEPQEFLGLEGPIVPPSPIVFRQGEKCPIVNSLAIAEGVGCVPLWNHGASLSTFRASSSPT